MNETNHCFVTVCFGFTCRIWDKVIGGSCVFLAFVAVAVFLTFRRPLLSMHSSEEMVAYLKNVSRF